MGLVLKDTQHHCYGDYLTWPDDMRYELIDGSAYTMSPAPELYELNGETQVGVLIRHEDTKKRPGKTLRNRKSLYLVPRETYNARS